MKFPAETELFSFQHTLEHVSIHVAANTLGQNFQQAYSNELMPKPAELRRLCTSLE